MEKKYRYLCLDDEDIQATIDRINGDNLEITLREPQNFEKVINSNLTEWDGLILDYRLDQNQENQGVHYKAPSLAQEIRNKITEGEIIKDLPIVLCSMEPRVKKLNLDETSNDLFDFRFIKEPELNVEWIRNTLVSLAEGYIQITKSRENISDMIQRNIAEIDDRVFAKFIDSEYPVHEIARYINRLIADETGVLISKDVLLARLGLVNDDISKELIDSYFNDCKYSGVFAHSDRWWMDRINNRFKEFSSNRALAGLNAIQRVNYLKNATGLDLADAKPIERSKSNRFWTVCAYTKRPLDPIEGFKLVKEPLFIWSEPRYISMYAIAKYVHHTKEYTLSPSEKQRVELELEDIE